MVRKGRCNLSILIPEAKIDATKAKIVAALQNMKSAGDIESATGSITYEEYPESVTV